jgi:hypothetical protein
VHVEVRVADGETGGQQLRHRRRAAPLLAMNGAFHVEACVVSKVWSYEPLVTLIGKPAKYGVVVATPALPGGQCSSECATPSFRHQALNTTWTRSE